MSGSIWAMCLLAVGWVMLWIILHDFSGSVLTIVFWVLVLAECLSAAICALATSKCREPLDLPVQKDVFGRGLLIWIAFCLLAIVPFQFRILPLFQGNAFALLCLLAIVLALVIIKLYAVEMLLSIRQWAAVGMLKVTLFLGGQDADVILLSVLLGYISLIFIVAFRSFDSERTKACYRIQIQGQSGIFYRYADLFVLPFLLEGDEALIYLFARCMSLIVTLVLSYIAHNASPSLRNAVVQHDVTQFARMAARLNLGFLLIGGSLCIAILTAGPYLRPDIPHLEADLVITLKWLLLGVAASVSFGAVEKLLEVSGQRKAALLFDVGAILLFGVLVLPNAQPSALFIAQCFSFVKWIHSAAGAIYLILHKGVWPGPTALLLREIRLF